MNCTFLSQAANWSLINQHFQHERGVPDMRVPRVLLPPPQKWILAQKRPNLAQNWYIWLNIFFGPSGPMPEKKLCQRGDFP